ncbi:hypothetical protein Tco_1159480 [Tanacetum coccineum]
MVNQLSPLALKSYIQLSLRNILQLNDRSTTEATSMNNVSPVDVYSLSGCVLDAEAPTVAESPLQMDNVNVPVVSFSGHYILQADATDSKNNPASLLKCSYCFRATIDDGTTITSLTCFSPEAHTLTRDSNEVVNELTNKDPYQLAPSAATFANIMCHQPLPPPLSPSSAKLMIMALEEYGYQSRRGIWIPKKWRSSSTGDVI